MQFQIDQPTRWRCDSDGFIGGGDGGGFGVNDFGFHTRHTSQREPVGGHGFDEMLGGSVEGFGYYGSLFSILKRHWFSPSATVSSGYPFFSQ